MKILLILLVFCLIFATKINATIINVPSDIDSIQGGINIAVDGDTVLVQPGTYYETINFNGKNIVVGSLTLTTSDTSYISQTLIDADNSGTVVTFENGEDSTTVLSGFTLINGNCPPTGEAGGIKILNSSPILINMNIINNRAALEGGGIYLKYSNSKIRNVTVSLNKAYSMMWGPNSGGGIFCDSSNITINSALVEDNYSALGGGISCWNSTLLLNSVIVRNNGVSASPGENSGGGIRFYNSEATLVDVKIFNNSSSFYGGGIYCEDTEINLSNVTIAKNMADYTGAGLYIIGNSQIIFDPVQRCDIYFNYAYHADHGHDICIYDSINNIAFPLDTFTVSSPTSYYAYPLQNYTFDILNGMVEPVSSDLFVDPLGNNSNSGIFPSEPLKTIEYAFFKIKADSINAHAVFLANGRYSPSTNGEVFPIKMRNYVSLIGESKDGVILDAENQSGIIKLRDNKNINIYNLTLTKGNGNGYFPDPNLYIGGAILCWTSDVNFSNLIISNNSANNGGAINYLSSYYSDWNATFTNVTICNNTALWSSGGLFNYSGPLKPVLINTILWNNLPESIGNINEVDAFYSNIEDHLWPGVGNISADPLFVEVTNGDYRLQVGSPCIDAGIQDTIIIYNNGQDTLVVPPMNFIGSAPDIGAYEYNPASSIKNSNTILKEFSLLQNYPNPFNSSTKIKYDLPKLSKVKIEIFNLLGQKIETLLNKTMPAGSHEVEFIAENLPSGVYYYRIEAGNASTSSAYQFQQVKKMLFLK